jgi:hypothetical protein
MEPGGNVVVDDNDAVLALDDSDSRSGSTDIRWIG